MIFFISMQENINDMIEKINIQSLFIASFGNNHGICKDDCKIFKYSYIEKYKKI